MPAGGVRTAGRLRRSGRDALGTLLAVERVRTTEAIPGKLPFAATPKPRSRPPSPDGLQLADALKPLPDEPGVWIVPIERSVSGLVREASAKGITEPPELEAYVASGLAACGENVEPADVRHLIDRYLHGPDAAVLGSAPSIPWPDGPGQSGFFCWHGLRYHVDPVCLRIVSVLWSAPRRLLPAEDVLFEVWGIRPTATHRYVARLRVYATRIGQCSGSGHSSRRQARSDGGAPPGLPCHPCERAMTPRLSEITSGCNRKASIVECGRRRDAFARRRGRLPTRTAKAQCVTKHRRALSGITAGLTKRRVS